MGKTKHPGELLLKEMEALGIGVRELARRADCSASYVSDIVNGKRGIGPKLSEKLSGVFVCTPDYWYKLFCDYNFKLKIGRE